jgi:hypothetical protein
MTNQAALAVSHTMMIRGVLHKTRLRRVAHILMAQGNHSVSLKRGTLEWASRKGRDLLSCAFDITVLSSTLEV